MISYGQKTLNKNDVRKATLRFILTFLLLTGLSFLAVFMFFKSSRMQAKNIQKEADQYHEMLGRNELLKIKMDSIYRKMELLSNDQVDNDIFLRNSIIEDLNVSRQLIGKDSVNGLQHYHQLIQDLQPMLTFKNDLLKLKSEQKAAQRNLEACLKSSGQVSSRIRAQEQAAMPVRQGRLFQNFRR